MNLKPVDDNLIISQLQMISLKNEKFLIVSLDFLLPEFQEMNLSYISIYFIPENLFDIKWMKAHYMKTWIV